MDLNQLLTQHQLALMAVTLRPFRPEAVGSFDLVGHYARRIARLRREMGVAQYPGWLMADPAPLGIG